MKWVLGKRDRGTVLSGVDVIDSSRSEICSIGSGWRILVTRGCAVYEEYQTVAGIAKPNSIQQTLAALAMSFSLPEKDVPGNFAWRGEKFARTCSESFLNKMITKYLTLDYTYRLYMDNKMTNK